MPSEDPEYNAELAQKRHDRIVNESWPALEAERLKFLSKDFEPNEDWWGSKVTTD
jgi:hypothetical protein